ncbi:hypothetical protein K440DRAFT_609120 [Wilcoxina mikolae CBS 423.85]|nr:hypothetical protein K440DRAFT_609120 [Wilcoxina mikolae CBS 423.85]
MAAVSRLPVPPEIVHEILRHLSLSSDCASCLQTDLAALSLSSKVLHAIATPYLYSSINLATLHDSSTYEHRLHSLLHTLSSSQLGEHVQHLQLSHSEESTEKLWAKIAARTPNLRILQGVETFFPTESDDDDEDHATESARALQGLRNLRKLVVHQEELPVRLSQLLGSWPELESLVIGDITADGSSFSDLSALGGGKLRELFFYDFDLDYATPEERDDAIASLPALETLEIEYSLGFSLSGVTRFLQQSSAHANRLKSLAFRQQLRRGNSAKAVAEVLEAAQGLRKLDLSLIRYGNDAVGEMPEEGLASQTLEELEWRGIYASHEAAASGNDEFVHLLVNSLHQLPRLARLAVGHEIRGRAGAEGEELQMFGALRTECDREGSVLTEDAEEIGKNGKRILLVVQEAGKGENWSERVAEMKRGVAGAEGTPMCAGGKDGEMSDGEGDGEKECEVWET